MSRWDVKAFDERPMGRDGIEVFGKLSHPMRQFLKDIRIIPSHLSHGINKYLWENFLQEGIELFVFYTWCSC